MSDIPWGRAIIVLVTALVLTLLLFSRGGVFDKAGKQLATYQTSKFAQSIAQLETS